MEKRFINKNVLITGSNRGIGREAMIEFMSEGANIIACTRNIEEPLKEEYGNFERQYNIKIYPIQIDLTDDDSIKTAIKSIKGLKINIDVMLNNAGIPHLALLPLTRMADARKVFQVNYFAQLMIIQGLWGCMRKSQNPVIINMASIAGIDGDIGNCVYGATKASMILATKVLSKEFATAHIRVNAVAPGLTSTKFADKMGIKAKDSMKEESLSGRLATVEEIANTILFLASDEAKFINGQVIRVDGGLK